MAGPDISTIGLNRVGHALEREEGNASRQKNIVVQDVKIEAQPARAPPDVIEQKVCVLEVAENSQVRHDANDEQ
jgi:hypothetical protein